MIHVYYVFSNTFDGVDQFAYATIFNPACLYCVVLSNLWRADLAAPFSIQKIWRGGGKVSYLVFPFRDSDSFWPSNFCRRVRFNSLKQIIKLGRSRA